jgi:hypothetical protein
MGDRAGSIRHLGTHRRLVSQTEHLALDATLTPDAVIVPASRPAGNLEQAITLARALQCVLLVLCSHKVKIADVHRLLARRSFTDAIVVNLPDNYRHELLDFPALARVKEDLPSACSWYVTDLSAKRNVGLLLARMLGWRHIFFLDDDIRDINPADVQKTVSMLGSYPAAGMRVCSFPDNSAVCHAHRATRGLQDVFITGAALAVDCQHNIGFFPDIYNEDWLFFFDNASRGQLGSSGHEVTQLTYDPFAEPERAAWQEFGDVLAEGLYTLLDLGLDLRDATDGYWAHFLEARRIFLEAILGRADKMSSENKEQLQLSVEMALKCSVKIDPGLLERYTLLWRRDLHDWQRRIAGVREMPSLEDALEALGLEHSTDGGAADLTRIAKASDTNGPATMPYTLQELYDLLRAGAKDDGRAEASGRKLGGRNRRAGVLPHHGSPGVHEGGRLAFARRAFRPRGQGATESSVTLDVGPAGGASIQLTGP